MSHEIERRFKERESNYSEQIKFDFKTREFYIARTYPHSEDVKRLPLSQWGLTRKVETSIIVCRQMESESYEQPVSVLFYKIALIYEIKEDAPYWYLISDTSKNESDHLERLWQTVSLKNVDSGQGMSCPIPNSLYKPEYPFLKITKSKAVKISSEELEELCHSGKVLGIFNMDLTNRITSS
jgi:hypothetical protein